MFKNPCKLDRVSFSTPDFSLSDVSGFSLPCTRLLHSVVDCAGCQDDAIASNDECKDVQRDVPLALHL